MLLDPLDNIPGQPLQTLQAWSTMVMGKRCRAPTNHRSSLGQALGKTPFPCLSTWLQRREGGQPYPRSWELAVPTQRVSTNPWPHHSTESTLCDKVSAGDMGTGSQKGEPEDMAYSSSYQRNRQSEREHDMNAKADARAKATHGARGRRAHGALKMPSLWTKRKRPFCLGLRLRCVGHFGGQPSRPELGTRA